MSRQSRDKVKIANNPIPDTMNTELCTTRNIYQGVDSIMGEAICNSICPTTIGTNNDGWIRIG